MDLLDTIKSNFNRSILSDYDGPSNEHPIIAMNALKNIIGDNKNNPSKNLLFLLEQTSLKYSSRSNDKDILEKAVKNGIGLTVFSSDLEDACQEGDKKKIEHEAARFQRVSENGIGIIELLLEVAMQDFDRLGLFAFHFQRSNAFNYSPRNNWSYVRCILNEICKNKLPDPHTAAPTEASFVGTNDADLTILLSSANRLWNGDYVRTEGFKREISYWYSSQRIEKSILKDDSLILKEVKYYHKNGGNFFIQIAESLKSDLKSIIYLEALRYWTKICSINQLPYVSHQILKLYKG